MGEFKGSEIHSSGLLWASVSHTFSCTVHLHSYRRAYSPRARLLGASVQAKRPLQTQDSVSQRDCRPWLSASFKQTVWGLTRRRGWMKWQTIILPLFIPAPCRITVWHAAPVLMTIRVARHRRKVCMRFSGSDTEKGEWVRSHTARRQEWSDVQQNGVSPGQIPPRWAQFINVNNAAEHGAGIHAY